MGEISLNDARGYFRDLVGPAFEEFWREYQRDDPVDRDRFMVIYRRLLTCMFFMNHMTDKVAKMRGYKSPLDVIEAVKGADCKAGEALEVCRLLVNDVKHPAKRLQTYELRDRGREYDRPGKNKMPAWTYTDKIGGLHELGDTAQRVWAYWVSHRHERK